ncbi:acyl-CoA desaturase [Marinicella gelatinilytica]|uniref:acyl-CoA desaturase n=1 Tax=Marinicella gelatinilytica TaxID=2996017 RepID=UPI002260EC0B|nr:acyl-CoA desaturase [Marinicella gelatinilytica]MCX7545190.1 acyl-CoA desaturase [Marinicella gelatinilytica]
MKKLWLQWFDNQQNQVSSQDAGIAWSRILPFVFLHLACLLVFFVPFTGFALLVCGLSYFVRMFAITAFYHRYFSHKSFKTGRVTQAVFAGLGATATQRGPLWWAAHHRHHHIHADTDQDSHSPKHGFWHSHMGWFLQSKNFTTQEKYIKDLSQYPELRFIDRYDIIFPLVYMVLLYVLGEVLATLYPALKTGGWQLVLWGYVVSTVLLAHVTYAINSLAHVFGSREFDTGDNSRNNFILALLTLGEGWHNNHHCCPGSVRQGFRWWQIDISYYGLWLMSKVGLIWDLKTPNEVLLNKKRLSEVVS